MRVVARLVLAAFFGFAGVMHLVATDSFRAQVPAWVPAETWVIWVSGVVEILIAAALALAPARWRPWVGWGVVAFLVVVFPGNLAQYLEGNDAFGLDSDGARLIRLFFQPLLMLWAWWSTRVPGQGRSLAGN